MSTKYVIAFDFGTSGVKAAIVSLQGEVIGTGMGTYGLTLNNDGWAEQVPDEYWSGVCEATKDAMKTSGVAKEDLEGVAFGTMWKGIIPVNQDGKVLHNSIIWLDCRAEAQAQKINREFGTELYSGGDYWPKLMWVKENRPEIIEEAATIFEVNSYLKWRACGESVMDISNCFVRSFDEKMDQDYEALFNFIGIPRSKFPRWASCDEKVGYVTARAAEEMGIREGTPVFAGCSDIAAIAIGSGQIKPGATHAYFGSSGWIGYCIPHGNASVEASAYNSPFSQDKDVCTPLGLNSAGLAINWVLDKLYTSEKQSMGDAVYDLLNEDVAKIAPGSENLFATPWFYGEVKPVFGPEARGGFLNLCANHSRAHMARAMMEGICYMVKATERYSAEKLGLLCSDTMSAVGGCALSDPMMQMLADILDMTVIVPSQPRHVGALGVASCALVGLGIYKDFDEVTEKVRIERTFKPIPENVEIYKRGYKVFDMLFQMQKPMFDILNG